MKRNPAVVPSWAAIVCCGQLAAAQAPSPCEVGGLLRDAPRDFSEITRRGVAERYTSRGTGVQVTVLAWKMPGATRCDVARGGERLGAGAAELTCEWSYGRLVDDAEARQRARALYVALADCMQKELTDVARDESMLALRGTTRPAHAVDIHVSAGSSSSGRSVTFQLTVRGRTSGSG